MFEFQGKTYKIVQDVVGELVAGCKQCAFHDKAGVTDIRCSEVDAHGTGRTRCNSGNHHYEEVEDAHVQ